MNTWLLIGYGLVVLAIPFILIWCLVFTISHAWHRGNLTQTIEMLVQGRTIDTLNRELAQVDAERVKDTFLDTAFERKDS
jgi:hypothetical protein